MQEIILTNMCMLQKDDMVLIQNRKKQDWPGYTLPGGKVDEGETIKDSVFREFKEETGLLLKEATFVDYIEWQIDNKRHLCLLFKANEYEGDLIDTYEGHNAWVRIGELKPDRFSVDFDKILDLYGIKWR